MCEQNQTQDLRFEIAFDEAIEGLCFINRQGFLQRVNKAFCRLTDASSEELLTRHLNDLLPPEERDKTSFDLTAVLADQPQIVEKRLIRKDSVSQFVEFSLKLITPDIILGTVRDISHRKRTDLAVQHAHEVLEERVNARTSELSAANAALQKEMTERQQAEQALRQAYQRLRMLLENSPLIVVEWDHRFRVTYWSEEAERFFGWPFEELRGKHPNQWQFVHEEDRPAVDGVINRLVDGSHQRYVGLNRNYRKDGSIVHCEWYNSAIYDETGQLISVLSLVLDVTLQRQASRALKESEKQYRRLVELCFDAVLTVSNDRILSINPAGSRFFGVDGPEDLIGHASAEFIQAESLARMAAHFQAAFEKQGELSLLEERIQRLDGTTIDVELASIQIVHQGQPAFQVVARDITARKQAQQALKASEAKFRSLTETTSAAIFIYQGDFNRYVNPMASTITGYTQEELLAMTFWDIVHPDMQAFIKRRGLARQKGQNIPERYELKIRTKQGTTRWVDSTLGMIEFGGERAILGTAFDITERKAAKAEQERLLIAEHKQRLLAETLGEVFLVLAAQTSREAVLDEILRQMRRLVFYSTANIALLKDETLRLVRWHGYHSHENTAGVLNMTQHLQDYHIDADVVRTRQPIIVADTSQQSDWRLEPDQAWIRSYISVPICVGDQVLGLIRLNGDRPNLFSKEDIHRLLPLANAAAITMENARLHDQARNEIAERILAEEELRQSETRNRALLNAIPDVIFRISGEGRYLDCEDGPHKALAVPSRADINKSLSEVLPLDVAQQTLGYIRQALATNEIQIFEYQLPLPHGLQAYETRLVVIGSEELLGIVRNITNRKRAVQQMIHAERLVALGRLSAALAHEMNNPLQVIQSHLDLILDFPLEPGERERYLHIIRQEILRLTDVNRRILQYARPAATPLQEVDLSDLIEQVMVLTRKRSQQNGIDIQMKLQKVPPIWASPSQLVHVFLSLIVNAVEATSIGGQVNITLHGSQKWAYTTIENDGPPIPTEVLPHLFEPFYTTKTDGVDLGLWISYDLIEQNGGSLMVENLIEPPRVCFTVKMPLSPQTDGANNGA